MAEAESLSARIVATEVGNDGRKVYTSYVLELDMGGETHRGVRRYNEFRLMDTALRALPPGKRPDRKVLPHLTGRTWGKGTQESVVAKRRPKLQAYLSDLARLAEGFPAIRRLLVRFVLDGIAPAPPRKGSERTLVSPGPSLGSSPEPRGRLMSVSGLCAMCRRGVMLAVEANGEVYCSQQCRAYHEQALRLGLSVDSAGPGAALGLAPGPPSPSPSPATPPPPPPRAGAAGDDGGALEGGPDPSGAPLVSRPDLKPTTASSRHLMAVAAGAADARSDAASQVRVSRPARAHGAAEAPADAAGSPNEVSQPVLLGRTTDDDDGRRESVSVAAGARLRGLDGDDDGEGGLAPASRRRTMLASMGESLRRMSSTAPLGPGEAGGGPGGGGGPDYGGGFAVVRRGGHLWKRGGFRGGRQNWKRRYFCLLDKALHYYQETTPTLLGVMALVGTAGAGDGPAALGGGPPFFAKCRTLLPREARKSGVPARAARDGPWAFAVSTPERTLLLCAESEADRQSWVEAVAGLVSKHRSVAVQRHSMGAGVGGTAGGWHPAGARGSSGALGFAPGSPLAGEGAANAGSPFPRSPSLYITSPGSVVTPGRGAGDGPGRLRRPRRTLLDVVVQREAESGSAPDSAPVQGRGIIHPPSPPPPPSTPTPPAEPRPGAAAGADPSPGGAIVRAASAGQMLALATPDGGQLQRSLSRASGGSWHTGVPSRAGSGRNVAGSPQAVVADGITSPRGGGTPVGAMAPLTPEASAGSLGAAPGVAAAGAGRASIASVGDGLGEEWMPALTSRTWEVSEEEIEVTERIGEGAFGDVYRGRLWGTDVAVKLVRKGAADLGTEVLEALRAEVAVLSQLRHPNVVLYLGAGTRPPSVFIVTEWCERGDLNLLLYEPTAPLSVAARVRLALHAAQGLTYLHSRRRGIVHRDLKSHNLLLTRHYNLKVADFGLTVFQGQLAKASTPDPAAEPAGLGDGAVGTPQWMAPEVLEGQRYDEKVDVYSFGVVLAELCSRVEPYSDRFRRWDFVDAVLEEGAAPTMPLWADTPPAVASALVAEAQVRLQERRARRRAGMAAGAVRRGRSRSDVSSGTHGSAPDGSMVSAGGGLPGGAADTDPHRRSTMGPAGGGAAAAAAASGSHGSSGPVASTGSGGVFAGLSLSGLSRAIQDAADIPDDDEGDDEAGDEADVGSPGPADADADDADAADATGGPWTRLPLWWTSDGAFCDAVAAAEDGDCQCLAPGPASTGGVGSSVAFAASPSPPADRGARDLAAGDARLVAALREARASLLAGADGERFPSPIAPASALGADWRNLPGRAEEWRCASGDCTGVLQLLATACLSRDPEKRPSFDEIADLLGALLASRQGRVFLELEVPRFREELAYGSHTVRLRAASELCHVASHALLAASRLRAEGDPGSPAAGLWLPGVQPDAAAAHDAGRVADGATAPAEARAARLPDALWACADLPFAFTTKLGGAPDAFEAAAAAFAAEPRCPVSVCDVPALRSGAGELVAALAGCMRAHGVLVRRSAGLPLEADAGPTVLASLGRVAASGVFGGSAAGARRRRTASGSGIASMLGAEAAGSAVSPTAAVVVVPVTARAVAAAAAAAAGAAPAAGAGEEAAAEAAVPTPSSARRPRKARRGLAKGPTGPSGADSMEALSTCLEALAVLVRASVALPAQPRHPDGVPADAVSLLLASDAAQRRAMASSPNELVWQRAHDALLPSLGRLAHSLSLLALCPSSAQAAGGLPARVLPRAAAAASALLAACWAACPEPRARALLAFAAAHTLSHAVARTLPGTATPEQAAVKCRAILALRLSDSTSGLSSAGLLEACTAVLERCVRFE